MDAEELFIGIVDDLHRAISSGDKYEYLQAAKCLRQLLADERDLIAEVNRPFRMKIRFTIREPVRLDANGTIRPTAHFRTLLDPNLNIASPPGVPEGNVVAKKRDAFLKTYVGIAGGEDLTVLQVIKYAANVAGGVHAGTPREAQEQSLHLAFGLLWGSMGIDLLGELISAISRIVLAAVTDLKFAVLRLERFENRAGIHSASMLAIYPHPRLKNNYLARIDARQTSVSLYVTEQGILCLRLDSAGGVVTLYGGSMACRYGIVQSIHFDLCCHGGELLLMMSYDGWFYCAITPFQPPPDHASQRVLMGSDRDGDESYFGLCEQLLYDSMLPREDRRQLQAYFRDAAKRASLAEREFSGHKSMEISISTPLTNEPGE